MIRCNDQNPIYYNHHDHHDYHHHKLDHYKLDHHKLDAHLRSSLEDVTQELRRLRPRTLRNFCSLSFHVSIADSAQTEYCSTFHCSCVRPCVTGVTSHISHIYKGINAILIIRDASTPIYSESKSSWLSF